jgi:ABC-type dipeptide/oligopeptide/nickel transport system permease subunit
MSRSAWFGVGLVCLMLLFGAAWFAPEHLSSIDRELFFATPGQLPPFGADQKGRPLLEYALQGARVVALPALVAGVLVAAAGVAGGLLRCVGSEAADALIQGLGEIVGALPRMLVILVVALVVPRDARSLLPMALAWALLSAPGAMDEAASVAERLGGSRFVEALRAHGYSAPRIYLVHIVGYNLRPVVVRQGAETLMQVVFLEIALSYLALMEDQPSFTHPDSSRSWAALLEDGYKAIFIGDKFPSEHALWLGLGLLALVGLMAASIGRMARAR